MEDGRIAALQRWPVKGLGPDPLGEIAIEADAPIPYDRAWAIENGPSGFDPRHPSFLSKAKFLTLMRDERLASLETRFEDADRSLTVLRDGLRVVSGRLDDAIGRALLEQFFAAYMERELRGRPKIVSAPGHTFSDCGRPVLSIIGLDSLRELERLAGRSLDPLRFRANVHVDGLGAWREAELVGRELACGDALLRVEAAITRCTATNVDPRTGARDAQIPGLLARAYRHEEFGVYARVLRGGTLRTGAPVHAVGMQH